MAPEVNWLPPDGAWCEARLFEKTNGRSQTKRNVTWILSLTLIQGKAPVWLSWCNAGLAPWTSLKMAGFQWGQRDGVRSSQLTHSLILWTSASSSLNKDMMFPSKNSSSMKLKGFLKRNNQIERLQVNLLTVTKSCVIHWRHPYSRLVKQRHWAHGLRHSVCRDLELRGLCLDNFWEGRTTI